MIAAGAIQKTREGCGCFWGLFGGSRGTIRESPGKTAGNVFQNRKMLQILGFGHRERHVGSILPGPFFEIESSSLLEFFWI